MTIRVEKGPTMRPNATKIRRKLRRNACRRAFGRIERRRLARKDRQMGLRSSVQFSSVHSFILIRKSFSTWADLPGNRIQGNDSKRRKEKNDNIYNYNYITSKSVHRVLIEIVLQAQFKDRGIITPSYDCRKRIP